MLRVLFHAVALGHHAFCAAYITTVDFSGATHSYLIDSGYYPWRFSTVWNFTLQTIFLTLCVAEDLILLNSSETWLDLQEKARKLRSFLFAALVFPNGLVVFSLFWALYFYDRELIYPAIIDTKLPSWYNHSLHTVVAVVVLLELVLADIVYPKRRKTAMIYINSYVAMYALMSLVTFWVKGSWVYPLLDRLTWGQRAIFLVILHLSAISFYHLGEFLHYSVYGGDKRRDLSKSEERKTT